MQRHVEHAWKPFGDDVADEGRHDVGRGRLAAIQAPELKTRLGHFQPGPEGGDGREAEPRIRGRHGGVQQLTRQS
jgi:hypothetical protein